jgi:hypothetical protein
MADLSFGNDAGLQDGTGDRTYPNFLHKFMSLVAVRHLFTLYSSLSIFAR